MNLYLNFYEEETRLGGGSDDDHDDDVTTTRLQKNDTATLSRSQHPTDVPPSTILQLRETLNHS